MNFESIGQRSHTPFAQQRGRPPGTPRGPPGRVGRVRESKIDPLAECDGQIVGADVELCIPESVDPENVSDHAARMAHEAGLRVRGCFIVGTPGETREDVRLTEKFIKKAKIVEI